MCDRRVCTCISSLPYRSLNVSFLLSYLRVLFLSGVVHRPPETVIEAGAEIDPGADTDSAAGAAAAAEAEAAEARHRRIAVLDPLALENIPI